MLILMSRSRAGIASAGSENWLLASGHYEPSKAEPIIVFPRADASSHSTERHRLAPSGRRWAIPVAMYSGAWPFYYSVDATSAAKGIGIGAQLSQSGGVLIVADDYAELSWDSPTVGSHEITVTVRTQEYGRGTSGYSTEKTVTFTLVVVDKEDTTKFVWLSGSGNDSTGDGSFSNPFRTLSKVFNSTSYVGRQCHVLTGSYDTNGSAAFALNSNTPAVLVIDDAATATVSLTQRVFTLSGDGCQVHGIVTSEGGHAATVGNQRIFTVGSGIDRWVFHRCNFTGVANGTAGDDNCTSIFSSGGGGSTARLDCAIIRCSETDRAFTSNSTGLFNLFAADQGVAEFNDVDGDAQYNMFLKDSNRKWSVRANRCRAVNGFGPTTGCQLQSYTTSDIEFSYNNTDARIVLNVQQVATTGVHHIFRNSGSNGLYFKNPNGAGTGPYYADKNAIEGTFETGSQVTSTNAECMQVGGGVLDAAGLLEGTYRTNYLGTRGAEVV